MERGDNSAEAATEKRKANKKGEKTKNKPPGSCSPEIFTAKVYLFQKWVSAEGNTKIQLQSRNEQLPPGWA